MAELQPLVLVVAAALVDSDGRVLIAQRPEGKSMAGLWEFPGGKVEHGETLSQALARELEEELGLTGVTCDEVTRYEYTYPGKHPIRLVFLHVTEYQGEPQNLIFEEIRWEPRQYLAGFDFVEGDIEFLRGLSSELY